MIRPLIEVGEIYRLELSGKLREFKRRSLVECVHKGVVSGVGLQYCDLCVLKKGPESGIVEYSSLLTLYENEFDSVVLCEKVEPIQSPATGISYSVPVEVYNWIED